MKAFLRIWLHEYRNIFLDSGVMLIFFGAILIYPIAYPIPYAHEVLKDVPVGVIDMDKSQLSRQLIRMTDANELINVVSRPASMTEAKQQFYKGTINGILVIPEDFTKKILQKQQATVEIYADASYFLLYRQVLTGVIYSTGTLSAGIEVKRLMAQGLTKSNAMAARESLSLISYPLFNAAGGYASYIVPPVLFLILQQTLLIGIGMIGGTAREKNRSHTLIPDGESAGVIPILLGKGAAYFSIYIIHAIYLFVVLFRFYRFPQRADTLELFLFILPFLISAIFMGLSLSVFFRNREISIAVLLFTSIPILFLAGFSWPLEAIPHWLRIISFLLPTTTGIDGFLKIIVMGADLREVGLQWIFLWGLAGFYFIIASVSMKFLMRKAKSI